MDRNDWRKEVARLLEHTALAIRAKNDRPAVVAFGTAIAYLQKARERGEPLAGELLGQVMEQASDGPTERFTFTPGELEALTETPKKA
jgi:hypothetical protein